MTMDILGSLIKLIIGAIAIYQACKILPGVSIEKPKDAFIVALLLGVLNIMITPILFVFGIVNFFTLGLFNLIMNSIVILMADTLIPSFKVDSFMWAILLSIVISIISALITFVLGLFGFHV